MTDSESKIRQELDGLVSQAREQAGAATSLSSLDDVRVRYLGKKGELTLQLKRIGSLPAELRPNFGKWVNLAKNQVQQEVSICKDALEQADLNKKLAEQSIDVTLPGRSTNRGGQHPVSRTLQRLEDIFVSMGFAVEEGP